VAKRNRTVKARGSAVPIDRDSSVPSYVQIAEYLRARIVSGAIRPGGRMPAESELVAQSGLSRVTIRQGLLILVREGWLVRKQGLGTFARHPIDQELTSVRTITEVLLSKGITPEVEVVSFGPVVPPVRVQRELRLQSGDQLLLAKRLYRYRGEPLALVYIYLPLAIAREAEILRQATIPTETTYTIWEDRLGVRLRDARHVIRAGAAGREDARALGVKTGAPILVLERITYDEGGRPLEYILFHYHAERYEFSAVLPRVKGRPPETGDAGWNGRVVHAEPHGKGLAGGVRVP
jgi:GntR family transcriptional regulator